MGVFPCAAYIWCVHTGARAHGDNLGSQSADCSEFAHLKKIKHGWKRWL